MRLASGVSDQYIYFEAQDPYSGVLLTGLSGFTVHRSRNGNAAAAFTTPTINETDSSNMPGVYELLMDEDMTIDSGDETQEMIISIAQASMKPVRRVIELYRPKITVGETLTVASGALGANTVTASSLATDAVAEIVAAVWDETLTGANHNVATSAGRRLREISNNVVTSGTAQGGSTNTITLAAGASATNGTYDPSIVRIVGGTGSGQARLVIDYNGTSKVAVVDRDWRTAPDNTSLYEIIAAPNLMSTNEGLAQGGGASTITLNANASSVNDTYVGQTVVIRTGTGQDQSRLITAYNGTTKVATVGQAWVTNPTSSSAYMILPVGRSFVVEVLGAAITAIQSGLGTAADLAVVDTVVDAIKVKTDSLTFTVAGQVDANIQYVNDVQVTGNGQSGSEWGPA